MVTLSRSRTVPVVGVSFVADYPHNLRLLKELDDERAQDEPLPVVLIRRPENPHDANAVEVHVPALGTQGMIGHLSRENAAKIAPLLDEGVQFSCYLNWVRIAHDHLERPGVDISIRKVVKDG
jgi:hypothetical protein